MTIDYIDQGPFFVQPQITSGIQKTQEDLLRISLILFCEGQRYYEHPSPTAIFAPEVFGIHHLPVEIYEVVLANCSLKDQNTIARTCKTWNQTQRHYFEYTQLPQLQFIYATMDKASKQQLLSSPESLFSLIDQLPHITKFTPAHVEIVQKIIALLVALPSCTKMHLRNLRNKSPDLIDRALREFFYSSGGHDDISDIIEMFHKDISWRLSMFFCYFRANMEFEMAKKRRTFLAQPTYLWESLVGKTIHFYHLDDISSNGNSFVKKVYEEYFRIIAPYFQQTLNPQIHISFSVSIEERDSTHFAENIIEIFRGIPRLIKFKLKSPMGFQDKHTQSIIDFIKSNPNLIALSLPVHSLSAINKKIIIQNLPNSIHPRSQIRRVCNPEN